MIQKKRQAASLTGQKNIDSEIYKLERETTALTTTYDLY